MTAVHPGGGASRPPGWPHDPDHDHHHGPGPEVPADAAPAADEPDGMTVTRTPVGPSTPGIGTPQDAVPTEPTSANRSPDPASLDVLAADPAPKGVQKRGSTLPAPPRAAGPSITRSRGRREGRGAPKTARVGPLDNIPVKVKQRSLIPHIVAARINNMSLRARLGAFVSLVVGVAVAIVALSAFFLVRVQYYSAFDKNLFDRAGQLLGTTELGDPTQIVLFPGKTLSAADIRVGIVYDDGITLTTTKRTTTKGQEEVAPPLADERFEIKVAKREAASSVRTAKTKDGTRFRMVAIPADQAAKAEDQKTDDTAGLGRAAFVLAQSVEPTEATLRSLGTALLIMAVSGVALAAYTGFLVARQGLRPVERLTKAAEHVAKTGELRPINVKGDDELARLGGSFNAMLATVERSHDRQRRLVADAGHELRTPLTSLRTNLDLLAQAQTRGGLSDEDKAELLTDVKAQVEELTGLVSDLVELARDDAEKAEDRALDMADIVANAVERARRRAPDVTFDVRTRPWTVYGDARSLERAVLNLLDNAGKWSPAGGTVTVRLSDGVISVADEGPGISEGDLPFVFERFYRSDESRTMPGSGLGLAIVRQAAERHRGKVTADRAPQGGALLRLSLPHGSSVTHTEG